MNISTTTTHRRHLFILTLRALLLSLCWLPLVSRADEVRIAVGMSRDEAVALIQKHSATDITPGLDLEVVGGKGERPTGIYWAFKDYDAVITLAAQDGKVTAMTYWTRKDFDENKSHRAATEQAIAALKIDTAVKAVSIEKR